MLKYTEKWKCENVSHSVVSNSLRPYGLKPTRLFCPWNFPGKNTGLTFSSPGDLPHPGIESVSPVLQADALLSEPPGLFVNCKIEVNELFLENKAEMEKLLSWWEVQLIQNSDPLGEVFLFYENVIKCCWVLSLCYKMRDPVVCVERGRFL